jgi:nicotinate phosphoribosyltransferase
MKLSRDKATYPGAKQVWRFTDESGKYERDLITLAEEQEPRAFSNRPIEFCQPLLAPVMKQGLVLNGSALNESREDRLARLNNARDRAQDQLSRLPDEMLALDSKSLYRVEFSERLIKEKKKLEAQITGLLREVPE